MFSYGSIQDRKRNQNATKIQNAYRTYLAKRKARDLYRLHYIRTFDEELQQYVYKNRRTFEIKTDKSPLLGTDELTTPRVYQAPEEYFPGCEDNSEGYFLCVTTNEFTTEKFGEINKVASDNDHKKISNIITHEFLGKFRNENVIILKNPSIPEFLRALEFLRKKCRRSGFLLLYLCTNLIVVKKGERKNKREDSYFVFKNSVWGKPQETALTCLSISQLAEALNKIQCIQKTVLLNYAFNPMPKKTVFPRAKTPYPSATALTRLANLANCAVIGACTIGMTITDRIEYFSEELLTSDEQYMDNKLDKAFQKINKTRIDTVLTTSPSQDDTVNIDAGNDVTDISVNRSTMEESIRRKFLIDWNVPTIPDVFKTPRPIKPTATWSRPEASNYQIAVTLPSTVERNNFSYRLAYWNVRRSLAKPGNYFKRINREHKRKNIQSPYQISLIDNGQYMFAKGFYKALRGGASHHKNPLITVKDLYLFLHKTVKENVLSVAYHNRNVPKGEGLPSVEEKDNEVMSDGGGSIFSNQNKGPPFSNQPDEENENYVEYSNQSPILILPLARKDTGFTNHNALYNPVGYRCGPPPPPERPFVTRIGLSEIHLQWYNFPFEGVQATKYKIFMRNNTRNYNKWAEVVYPGEINKTNFLVRDLPRGVPCQFRVSAFNNGGWSVPSLETALVTPGENQAILPDELRWRKLAQGGPTSILDRMSLHPKNRDENVAGLRYLLALSQNHHGFNDTNISIRAVKQILVVANLFKDDLAIITTALQTLGWCLISKKKGGERTIRQTMINNKLVELCAYLHEKYRFDNELVGIISWLRSRIGTNYLPEMPRYVHKSIIPPKVDFVDSDDDDDEDDSVKDEIEGEQVVSAV